MNPDELQKLIRLLYTGFSDGAILALIALGLVLVYKATDVINFAHGEFMMLGAYVGYQSLVWLSPVLEGPLLIIVAIALMTVISIGVGVLVERLILRPMIGESVISVIMITIGMSNIIQALVGGIWGKSPRALPADILPGDGRFELIIEGARRPLFLSHTNLWGVVIVMLITAALILFFRYSKHGIAMRAAADDQQAAMSMGISIRVVFALAWSLAAVTAAAAGLMIADLTTGVSGNIPGVGLRAFPVIILGGLDSIAGAIIGGFAIALIETFASGYIDPSLKDVIPYMVLLVVLMVRPYGLFGQTRIERV